MSRISTRRRIPRPPSEVFDFVADLRKRGQFLPRNHSGFAVLTDQVEGAGARAAYELAVAGRTRRLVLAVAESEEGRRIVERTGVEEPTFTTVWEFQAADGETLVTLTIEYQAMPGLVGGLIELLVVRARLRRNYAELLRNLERALARQASG